MIEVVGGYFEEIDCYVYQDVTKLDYGAILDFMITFDWAYMMVNGKITKILGE